MILSMVQLTMNSRIIPEKYKQKKIRNFIHVVETEFNKEIKYWKKIRMIMEVKNKIGQIEG